jgi:RNA polymerase sigma-70 factor (ECF subfamily)
MPMERQGPIKEGEPVGASDEQLLQMMATGDESALSAFYDRYRRLVYSLAVRVVGTVAEAEEVVSDVFWQAWQEAGRYNASRGRVYTWVMMMARTRAIDKRRAMQRHGSLVDVMDLQGQETSGTVADPDDDLILVQQRQRVKAALASLPAPQRQALELAYFDGLTQSEIAAALNEPLGTVKTRIRIGLSHLRELLAAYV